VGWDWSQWFQHLLPALGAVAVWAAILAAFATNLTTTRKAYQYGLFAAVFAYVVTVAVSAAVGSLFPDMPALVFLIIAPPVVEEVSRMLGVVEVRHRTDARGWLAFGAGYGLLEAGLKLFDGLLGAAPTSDVGMEVAAHVFTPLVPLLLHVFLSVMVFALLRKGVPLIAALVVAMAAHGLHNWSALTFVPPDWFGFLIVIFVRCAVFVALIAAAIRFSRQPELHTSAAAG